MSGLAGAVLTGMILAAGVAEAMVVELTGTTGAAITGRGAAAGVELPAMRSVIERGPLLGRSLAQASERPDLWRPAITERMFGDGPDLGQAMGWRSQRVLVAGTPHRMLWHPGFTGCALGLIPGLGVAITVLSNRLLADTPQPTATLWATALEGLGIAEEGSQP